MRKILLTVVGSAAMLVAVGHVASAKDRHHVRQVEQRSNIFADTSARNANAQYRVAPQFDGYYRYDGALSAPAGR